MGSVPRDLLWSRGWEGVLAAAHGAGGNAAGEIVQRCSRWALGRTARVWAQVGPAESPVVRWLRSSGRAATSEELRALIEIVPRAAHLAPVLRPERKARALLVRQAYARAFCEVLVEETGVTTEIRICADPRPSCAEGPENAQDRQGRVQEVADPAEPASGG